MEALFWIAVCMWASDAPAPQPRKSPAQLRAEYEAARAAAEPYRRLGEAALTALQRKRVRS